MSEEKIIGAFHANLTELTGPRRYQIYVTDKRIVGITPDRSGVAYQIVALFLYAISLIGTLVLGAIPLPESVLSNPRKISSVTLDKEKKFEILKSQIRGLEIFRRDGSSQTRLVVKLDNDKFLEMRVLPLMFEKGSQRLEEIVRSLYGVQPSYSSIDKMVFDVSK